MDTSALSRPSSVLLLLLSLSSCLASESTESTESTAGGCDESQFLSLCDGWAIAAIVMFGLLGLLILLRIASSFCWCEIGGRAKSEDELGV